MKRKILLLSLTLLLGLFSWNATAQTTFSWRNDQNPTSGQWNVSNYWWNGAATLPGGTEILFLDGSIGTTMTNDLPSTNRHKIIFGSTNTPAARTINGTTSNTFYDYSTVWPRIENDAVGITHTLNFPMVASPTSGINFELVPMVGPLVFGGTINNNGRDIKIYGNNTAIDGTNKLVTLSGIVSGAGALNVSQFGIVKLNAQHTYTGQTQIDNGEVWLESIWNIPPTSATYVGNGGQMANVAKLFISKTGGGIACTRNITINPGNTSTRFIGGLNTTALSTVTYSGTITGPASATCDLNLEQVTANTNSDFTGVIANGATGGVLNIVKVGAGISILSGVNTYTGSTTISAGNLKLNPSANTSNATQYIMNGGTLSTNGIAVGRTITASTLQLNDNSTIFVSVNQHTLSFAASNGLTWVAGKTLTISNWTPLVSRIYVGNSSSGLTASQLAQISFAGYTGTASILSTGEIVPTAAVRILGANGLDGMGFSTLKAAFDAINANASGLSTDKISIQINANTTETATAVLNPSKGVSAITTAPGSGYAGPKITLNGGTNTVVGTTVTTITNGVITSIVMSSGNWTVAPTSVAIAASGGGGSGAAATLSLSASQVVFTITNGGTGYGPIASFSGGGGTGAAVDVTMTTGATAPGSFPTGVGLSYALTCPGSGYTSTPTCAISAFTGATDGTISVATLYPSIEFSKLAIYPTVAGKSISGAVGLISIVGRKNVTIDGRVNRIGTPTVGNADNLIISCSHATNPAITFNGNAQNDTVQYCTLKGQENTNSLGILNFGTGASLANGNGLNVIDHNLITSNLGVNYTMPTYAIYAQGNSAFPNTGNIISNNEFKDLIGQYFTTTTINILGGLTAPQNDNYNIFGNSFYSATLACYTNVVTKTILQIGSSGALFGGSHTITGNYIGGNAANCSGTLTKTDIGGTFNGMLIYPSGSATSILNNTIQNISWTNGYTSTGSWTGIYIAGGSGAATITGNSIGDNSSIGSIKLINYSSGNLYAILINNTGTTDCLNNKIGSITTSNTGSLNSNILCIDKTATTGTTTISNNTIGSTTIGSSINASSLSTNQAVTGIRTQGTGTINVNNNTIANLVDNASTGTIYSINVNGGSTVNANLIHSNSIIGATSATVYGIWCGGGSNTLTNNIIRLGNNNSFEIKGIGDGSNTNNIYHNTVYLSGAPTTLALNSACLWSSQTSARNYTNNILFNARSNNGASGSHYAMNITTSGSISPDYNDYFVSGTGGVLGRYVTTDKTTSVIVTGKDANSKNLNPSFANTSGTSAVDFKAANTSLTGVTVATVTTDYAGTNRTAATIGAYFIPSIVSVANGVVNSTSLTLSGASQIEVAAGAELNLNSSPSISKIILAPTAKLTMGANTITAPNGVIFQSDATGTATLTGDAAVSNATVQQYVTSGRNWYLSPSVLSPAYSTLNLGTSVVEWNETTKVWDTKSSGTLTAGKGYIQVATSSPSVTGTTGTVNFTGTTNAGNITTSSLTRTGAITTSGFNLVGNPYPSYLRWSGTNSVIADVNNSGIGTSFWYRTKNDANAYIFVTHNGTSGYTIPSGQTANTTITGVIPPMQAFWVRVNSSTTTMKFTNVMRLHADNALNKFKAPKIDERKRLRLQLANGTATDEALIYFDADAANGFDNYDSPKMLNNSTLVPDLYSKAGNEKLVINGLAEVTDNLTLPLGFTLNTVATGLILKVNELSNFAVGTKVYLLDNDQSTQTELLPETQYTFNNTALTTNNESRFSLLFRAPGSVSGFKATEKLIAQVFVNAANQIVIIAPEKTAYAIYNAVGMLLENGQTTSNLQTANCKLNTGVYVVKVGNNNSIRVIIK
jgi:autotransporter-associated beta strand protein